VQGEEGCRFLEAQGQRSILSSYCPKLARVLADLGRLDDAEGWAELARKLGAEDDLFTQIVWRTAKAKVLIRRGQAEEAARLAHEAVEFALQTDMLNEQGTAFADLGEVLELAGDAACAAEAYDRALDCYERKGNVVSAEWTRERLQALQPA